MHGNKFIDDEILVGPWKKNESKIAWMSWDKMGLSKSKCGLGYGDLECFNIVLLAK
jgi:hypothetical protein